MIIDHTQFTRPDDNWHFRGPPPMRGAADNSLSRSYTTGLSVTHNNGMADLQFAIRHILVNCGILAVRDFEIRRPSTCQPPRYRRHFLSDFENSATIETSEFFYVG